jgi:hypothetical protein
MSRSVFHRNRVRSAKADKIMEELNDDQNPDMKVNFRGYMHGGRGFAIEVLNMENITEATTKIWKKIIEGQGLTSNIVTDMMGGKVDIKCIHAEKRQERRSYLNSFVYLSMSVFFIYMLWTRHRQ